MLTFFSYNEKIKQNIKKGELTKETLRPQEIANVKSKSIQIIYIEENYLYKDI